MIDIFITILTFVLIVISAFLVLVVLMQRSNANAGMGAAFGGGMAESTFGAEAGNILTRATIVAAALFFLTSTGLFLLHMNHKGARGKSETAPYQLPATQAATNEGAPATGAESVTVATTPTPAATTTAPASATSAATLTVSTGSTPPFSGSGEIPVTVGASQSVVEVPAPAGNPDESVPAGPAPAATAAP